jgi:hypothetical protein
VCGVVVERLAKSEPNRKRKTSRKRKKSSGPRLAPRSMCHTNIIHHRIRTCQLCNLAEEAARNESGPTGKSQLDVAADKNEPLFFHVEDKRRTSSRTEGYAPIPKKRRQYFASSVHGRRENEQRNPTGPALLPPPLIVGD